MKKCVFITILVFLPSISILATNVPLDTIKAEIMRFMQKNEGYPADFTYKSVSNDVIKDLRIKKTIEEGMNGVFTFFTISFHKNLHFLLVDDSGYEIINMREAFDSNLEKLMKYFNRNKDYSKEDILFYLSEFIRVHKRNKIEDKRVA